MAETTHPSQDATATARQLLERAAADRAAQVAKEKARGQR